jgi:hypothetical protein
LPRNLSAEERREGGNVFGLDEFVQLADGRSGLENEKSEREHHQSISTASGPFLFYSGMRVRAK